MNKTVFLCVAAIGTMTAQTRLDLRTQARNIDFSAASATKPFKTGTTLPATCSTGEAFFKSDAPAGANWYACSGPNTWTVQSGGGTGAAGASRSADLTDLAPQLTSETEVSIGPGSWGIGNAPVQAFSGSVVSIRSLAITGATNASPIVLTVATSGTSLRNGDTITVSGVTGNTAANGTWSNIEVRDSTHIALPGTTGNGTYAGGGVLAGAGNGNARVYGTGLGYIVVEHPASAGLVLSCTGSCVLNQLMVPTFAADSVPIAMLTIAGGKFTEVGDQRRFLTNRGISAGQGINVGDAGGSATIAVDSTVARTSGANIYTGSNSFTSATRTAPFRAGTTTPAGQNCTVGDAYFQTTAAAGQNLWMCTATGSPGTWNQLGGAAAPRQYYPAAAYSVSGLAISNFAVDPSQTTATVSAVTTAGGVQYGAVAFRSGVTLYLHHRLTSSPTALTVNLDLTQTDGAASGNWSYSAAGACIADDGGLDPTFGTAVTTTKAAPNAATLGKWTLRFTPSGTCAPGSFVVIRLTRNSGGQDSLWAKLLGAEVLEQ